MLGLWQVFAGGAAAAAAKSLQLCPTLCNPIDSRPSGSPVAGESGTQFSHTRDFSQVRPPAFYVFMTLTFPKSLGQSRLT